MKVFFVLIWVVVAAIVFIWYTRTVNIHGGPYYPVGAAVASAFIGFASACIAFIFIAAFQVLTGRV